jgi:transglutaminase-like putative cysteine protease
MILLRQGDSRFAAEVFRRFRSRRIRAVWAFLVAILAQAGMTSRAADAGPSVQPPSKWVVPLKLDKLSPDDAVDPSQDYRWLLSDRQINAQNDEEFVHEARQILNSAGVQYGSHVMIKYDPTCEALTFHWARLWRGTNKLDRLDLSKLHVSQAGLDTDELLFSSEKTALLMLDDVRVGDIVEYAYTIEGTNPALAGKFADSVQLQFRLPVGRVATRLIWPSSRKLYIKNHLTDLQPTTSRKSNTIEYTWDARNMPGLRREPPTPIWYDPYPWVQLSEFQKWSDVNRWALRLFTTTNAPSPELAKKINEWKQLPEPADRVLAALRFVQEEIRYLGMEDGAAGYEPAQPSVVFARRFGDCKDKSLLLVTILRALKIEAFPVLVNDRRRQELAELQPSPTLFNHVLVQVNLGGQSFWLDTTATFERGALPLRFWPAYGWGLMVGPAVTGLTPIPPCPVQPRTTVTEYLNIGLVDSPSTAKIVTVAEGPDADRLRERFATTPREDIERDNLNAYAKLYPFMSRTAPLVYNDDEQQNRVETTEFYAIERMWSKQADEPYFRCRLYCLNVDESLVKPAVSFRTMPLGVVYPVHQIFHAEVSVPTSWPIPASNTTIENPAFLFQRVINVAGGKLLLDYEYRSLSDAVAPEAVPAYVRDLDSATDALVYSVIGM